MKRSFLSLLLTVLLALSLLSACGSVPQTPAPEETAAPAAETPAPVTAAPSPAEAPAPTEAPAAEPPAPTPEVPDYDPAELHPLLWKVTDPEGRCLYLFGTIHVGDGRSSAVLEKVTPFLLDCDALAVEFDLVAYEKDLVGALADYQQFVYLDGSSIHDHMPEELYEQCAALLQEAGAYSTLLDYYNLGMWSQLTEAAALLTRSSLDANLAMDRLLILRAYEARLPVREVESASFQMGLLNSFPDELNLLLLEETLKNLEEYGESVDELYTAWLGGDYDAVLALALGEEDEAEDDGDYTEEQLALVEDYNRAMIDDRNRGMLQTALGYLESGDTVFLAVGAGHMVGEQGLAQLLRDAGCTVELVTY